MFPRMLVEQFGNMRWSSTVDLSVGYFSGTCFQLVICQAQLWNMLHSFSNPNERRTTTNLNIGHEDAPSPAVNVCKWWWEIAMCNCDFLSTVAGWFLLCLSTILIENSMFSWAGRQSWQDQTLNTHRAEALATPNAEQPLRPLPFNE